MSKEVKTVKSKVRYHNEHILHVESGVATNDEFSALFRQTLDEKKLKTDFKVNLIHLGGKPIGYGYVWVASTQVFHQLCGRNPDGSARFEEKDDPKWKAPPAPPKRSFEQVIASTKGRSWADIDEEDTEEEKKYTCPKIRLALPPLLTMPPMRYTSTQREKHRQLMIDLAERKRKTENRSEPIVPPSEAEVPKEWHFKMTGAHVGEPDAGCSRDVICGAKIPEWITPELLKQKFACYVSNPDASTTYKNHQGKRVTEHYPVVNINSNRMAFIKFDPRSKDAQFVLLMTRRMEIESKDGRQRAVLSWNPARAK